MDFPATLKELESYIGLVGYFRHYIERFAQKVEPLQERKTLLLKGAPKQGNDRKAHARNSTWIATEAEKRAFDLLQNEFRTAKFIAHYDPERQLYVDLDASYDGMGAMAYYVKQGYAHTDLSKPPPRTQVVLVLFLSRGLSTAERRYWPTELEVFCLVWVLKKVRHLVEAARDPVVVYTDHGATVGLATQSTLHTTTAVERLNLRLVRASEYM